MEISYTEKQREMAGRAVEQVYDLARRKLGLGCIGWNEAELDKAFQVFRYAFREWAEKKEVGVVLRALMYGEKPPQEVSENLPQDEIGIYCDDESTAKAIERLLKRDGYEEDR